MKTVDDYLELITPLHRGKPKFVASLTALLQPIVDLQNFMEDFYLNFDVDVAVGVQLDAVGAWVGRSRNIPVPLPNLWFTWGDPVRGWGLGIWKGPYDTGSGISSLDDDTYRRLIKAKILANHWDGTLAGAQAIVDAFFTDPDTLIFIEDDGVSAHDQNWFTFGDPIRGWGHGVWEPDGISAEVPASDMRMTVGIAGKVPSLLDLTLLANDYLPIRPESVNVTYAVTSVNNTPLFGFGVQNAFVSGWGTGSWGVPPSYVTTHPV